MYRRWWNQGYQRKLNSHLVMSYIKTAKRSAIPTKSCKLVSPMLEISNFAALNLTPFPAHLSSFTTMFHLRNEI